MITKTIYSLGHDKFKNDVFSSREWSAPTMVNPVEIQGKLDSFHLVGRRIKDIRFIGLCYNLRREWIEENAYNDISGSEEEKQRLSDYDQIPNDLMFLRFAEIDEPLLIKFEDETDSRSIFYDGDIFEIDTPQQPEFRMSMNSIPWWIEAGTNLPNMEAKVLFSPCIGKTISGVEVNTYLTKRDPMAFEDFSDGSERELVSNIILRLEDGTGIVIEGWIDYCHVSCVNSANEGLLISFDELKKGLFNWEDLHIDPVNGFVSESGSLFFGAAGARKAGSPSTVFDPGSKGSELSIGENDIMLLNMAITWQTGHYFDDVEGYSFSHIQWSEILEKAEQILRFETFDDLFDCLTGLEIKYYNGDSVMLHLMNVFGKEFWNRRSFFRAQLDDLKAWTAIALSEDGVMEVIGY